MNDQTLETIIPRHNYGLMALFAIVAVLGGFYISSEYRPALNESGAAQTELSQQNDWVPFSIRGDTKYYSLSAREILAEEYLFPSDEPGVNIFFMQDGYPDVETLQKDITLFAKFLATDGPLQTKVDKLYFHYLDKQQNLVCKTDEELFYCDYGPIMSILNDIGLQADYIVVMKNGEKVTSVVYDVIEERARAYYEKEI